MMGTSIIFGIFPGQLLRVIRSGVDPILARIIEVAPVATQVGGVGLP
jgi:NADH-quinone oxidoreductase subunit M